MASAVGGVPTAQRDRSDTVAISNELIMEEAIDRHDCLQTRIDRAAEAPQIASLKALRDSVRLILNAKIDDIAFNILLYIMSNEPVSVYRVGKSVPYSFSLTYKKANKLLREGLIRPITVGDSKDRRCKRLFESTIKGLLTSWNFGYIDDHEMCESLKKKWNIGTEALAKFGHVFKLLPSIASDKDAAIFEDIFVLAAAATAYESCRSGMKTVQSSGEDLQAKKYASRYVLANALKKVSLGRIVVFASKDYTISYEPDLGKTFVYDCTMCNIGCCMAEVPSISPKCNFLNDLLASFSLRSSPSP